MTLLEWIYLKVNATISTFEKLGTWIVAKGNIRPYSSKIWHFCKKIKTAQTLYILYLMYLQSFWLRNMHLKTTFSLSTWPWTSKSWWSATRLKMKQEAQTTFGDTRNIFCVFYFMYVVGQTLVSGIEESNWFQQRFILDYSFKVILFLLFCLPLTLSYSYFFS